MWRLEEEWRTITLWANEDGSDLRSSSGVQDLYILKTQARRGDW